MGPASHSKWGRCDIVTIRFRRHYLWKQCVSFAKTAASSYYSYNLSIMFLELVTSIELWVYDIKYVELKSWELIIKN